MFAYNHKRSEWKEVASMKAARSMFGAVIHNGKIVVAGGVTEDGLTGACEAYDFSTNKYVFLFQFVQRLLLCFDSSIYLVISCLYFSLLDAYIRSYLKLSSH